MQSRHAGLICYLSPVQSLICEKQHVAAEARERKNSKTRFDMESTFAYTIVVN